MRCNSRQSHERTETRFDLQADYRPAGDQPEAIAELVDGLENGLAHQTLLGVTGIGKTFPIANVIERVQRPTLVMAHNKTLAAQLYGEFREFFPDNAVEYFVSYYDYYQPEAYVPSSDTYIEKDASINAHIEQMRLSATKALLERPRLDHRRHRLVDLRPRRSGGVSQHGAAPRSAATASTSASSCAGSPTCSTRATSSTCRRAPIRVRGDVIDIFPAESEREAVRVELFDDEIESLALFDPLTGEVLRKVPRYTCFRRRTT